MRRVRSLFRTVGLLAMVAADLLRPTRPEYRLPARWLAR